MNDALVRMENIEKYFPGVHALSDCQFEVKAGEVHALVGENGAGKSTLMKILTGVFKKDSGRILYKGREVDIRSPRDAQDLGISIIHQEFNLMPHLTVAQNIFIGREPRMKVSFFANERQLNLETLELLKKNHMDLFPTTKVSDLTVARQQMVEIAKALSFNADVLIMDEPTAALTDAEIDELFTIIKRLKDSGVAIVYISHRMEELKRICDRVTVLRDGKYIDTRDMSDTTVSEIISMMVGREIYETVQHVESKEDQEVVLEVKDLNRGRQIQNVSFHLKKGEILGFAGLMGAGRTEVARAIFGADPLESGEIIVKGRKVNISQPKDAVKYGIGYLSEDRKRYGLALGLDVETNVVLSSLKRFSKGPGWVDEKMTRETANRMVDTLRVRTPSIRQIAKNLSGGNQQKLIIGKWLVHDADILIFDEPTRGIDVGAKSEIYHLLNELVKQGKSIIMISSELPEILRMSHRVIVMCEGRITGEFDIADATQEAIMHCATDRSAHSAYNRATGGGP